MVTFAGVDGVSKYANNFDKNNFGPRFGFAYRVGDKWAIRGAYGIFYDGQYAISATRILTLGFGVNGSFGSSSGTVRLSALRGYADASSTARDNRFWSRETRAITEYVSRICSTRSCDWIYRAVEFHGAAAVAGQYVC